MAIAAGAALFLLASSGAAPLRLKATPGFQSPDQPGSLYSQVERAEKWGSGAVIELPPGRYQLPKSLVIRGKGITILGKPGAMIVGGPALGKGAPVTDPDLLASLPAAARPAVREHSFGPGKVTGFTPRGFGIDGPSHTELFADGVPLRPARWPNPEDPWLLTGETKGTLAFQTAESRPQTWKQRGEIWCYGYWQFDWADAWVQLEGISPDKTVSLKQVSGGALKEFGLAKGRRYFFSNVLEELDQPGEYWIDPQKGRLLVWAPPGARTILASQLADPLIDLQGAEKVVIEGVSFGACRTLAVKMSESKSCRLVRCEVANSGGDGVQISGGESCGVFDSTITQTGGTGASLQGGDRATLTPSSHIVQNSLITSVARWTRTYKPAVFVDGVGQKVVGCTLSYLPHNAILFGGNDHLFEKNLVEKVCLDTSDSGAFYIGRNFTTRGTVIRHCHFRNIEPRTFTEGNWGDLVMGVYLDDCQAGISIIGCIFEMKGTGIMIGGGRDNVVEGCVFLGCNPGVRFDQRAKGWAKTHFESGWGYQDRIKEVPVLSEPWRKSYPALAKAIETGADLALAEGNVMKGNVYSGPKWIEYSDGLAEKDLVYSSNLVLSAPVSLQEAVKKSPAAIPLGRIGASLRDKAPHSRGQ